MDASQKEQMMELLGVCPLSERDALSAELEQLKEERRMEKLTLEGQVSRLQTELAGVKQQLEEVKKDERSVAEFELKDKEVKELALLRKTFGIFKKGVEDVFNDIVDIPAKAVHPPTCAELESQLVVEVPINH